MLYVGGGTPSLWPVEQLGEAVAVVSAVLREGAAELSREHGMVGMPGSSRNLPSRSIRTEAYARALRRLGVNRVSMGVQSFSDRSLRWMARRHSSARAVDAFRVLRSAGFDNISLDLIFGYDPVEWRSGSSSDEELMQLWSDDLDAVLRLRPEHISAYQMGIEEGSVLGEMTAAGRYREPSDELCAAQYALLQERLAAAGYEQYEVSNFSLPGRRALHNSGYWNRSPYIGLGPGAHSFDGGRCRWWNAPDLDRYIAAFGGGSASGVASDSGVVSACSDVPVSSGVPASGVAPITGDFPTPGYSDCAVSSVVSEETLTDEDVLTETVMLGLRTVDGLPLDVLVAMCRPSSSSVPDCRSGAADHSCHSLLSQLPRPLRTYIDRLLATGSLILRDGRLSIPPSRLFISDSIIRELL